MKTGVPLKTFPEYSEYGAKGDNNMKRRSFLKSFAAIALLPFASIAKGWTDRRVKVADEDFLQRYANRVANANSCPIAIEPGILNEGMSYCGSSIPPRCAVYMGSKAVRDGNQWMITHKIIFELICPHLVYDNSKCGHHPVPLRAPYPFCERTDKHVASDLNQILARSSKPTLSRGAKPIRFNDQPNRDPESNPVYEVTITAIERRTVK